MNNQKNSLGKHFFIVLFFVVLVIVFVIFYNSNFKNGKNVEMKGQVACINDNCFYIPKRGHLEFLDEKHFNSFRYYMGK